MDHYKTKLSEINYYLFLKVVKEVKGLEVTRKAPLGYSTKDIVLFGREAPGRCSCVSVRNHSGTYSMLITTPGGEFLFNGGYSMSLPMVLVAKQLYKAFKAVRHKITNND